MKNNTLASNINGEIALYSSTDKNGINTDLCEHIYQQEPEESLQDFIEIVEKETTIGTKSLKVIERSEELDTGIKRLDVELFKDNEQCFQFKH